MKIAILLLTSLFTSSVMATDTTKWEVEVPVSEDAIEKMVKDVSDLNFYEDGGISCGGKIMGTTIKAVNPVDWTGYLPGVSKIENYTEKAFFKFTVKVTTPVNYCVDEREIDCEVSFNTFDPKTGKLNDTEYEIYCNEE